MTEVIHVMVSNASTLSVVETGTCRIKKRW